jgi:hypothetical protein
MLGEKAAAKNGFWLFAFLCIILAHFAVNKNKNFIFHRAYGCLIHSGLVIFICPDLCRFVAELS